MEEEEKPVAVGEPEEKDEAKNPVLHETDEAREETRKALGKEAPENVRTAKEAFASFGKSDLTETAKRMLEIGKGENPQVGALAFLHSDEEEAIDGYRKALPFFKGDEYSTAALLEIIRDEERHERTLKELFGRYVASEK